MKNAARKRIVTVLAGLLLAGVASAAGPRETLEALEAGGNTDPQAWRTLAVEAREAGEPGIAAEALERAVELGLPALNADFERARQHVVAGRNSEAVALLEGQVEAGFTGLNAITGDPVLGTLAGNARFDALVAGLEKRAYPCAHQERFRAFDFWLGEWDVHLANGQFAGTNTITSAEKGCVLIERWESANGGTGRSVNYLDTAANEWVQVWNDASGSQVVIRGGMTDEGMRLTGKIHYVGTETTADFRGLWTPLPDGRVRQFFEQSTDGGESWTAWFEGFYSRRDGETGR